jgi:8-oxo-dGTP diphosphatase
MPGITYEYPRPMVTVDCIVTTHLNQGIHVLLICRANEPFRRMWALPGGFVDQDEDLPDAARRELKEETGIDCQTLKQFRTYGTPGRDPRGHTISVVYVSNIHSIETKAGDDAEKADWFNMNNLPEMAFDHRQIVEEYLQTLNR